MQEKYYSDIGESGVKKIINSTNQDVIVHSLYRLKFGHYEVINSINTTSHNWNVQNSLGDKCSKGCYCGYKENRSKATNTKWINGKKGVKSILIFTRK